MHSILDVETSYTIRSPLTPGIAMTKEELDALPRKKISDVILGWEDLSLTAKTKIECAFNEEWWRGYHARGAILETHEP